VCTEAARVSTELPAAGRGLVRVEGYLCAPVAVRMAAAAGRLVRSGCAVVDLDLEGVHLFNCSGLRGVVDIQEALSDRGVAVHIRAVTPTLRAALGAVGLLERGPESGTLASHGEPRVGRPGGTAST